jgi:hypothetical protein
MASSKHFHQFALLPPELQLKVWEAACPRTPSMQVFDVCFPSQGVSARSHRAFTRGRESIELDEEEQRRYDAYSSKVYLDALETSDETMTKSVDGPSSIPQHRYDPSQYLSRDALRATCLDSSGLAALPNSPDSAPSDDSVDVNTVFLPGPNRTVRYDNRTDVLHLRLRADNADTSLFQQNLILNGPDPIIPGFNDAPLDIDTKLDSDSSLQVADIDTLSSPNSSSDGPPPRDSSMPMPADTMDSMWMMTDLETESAYLTGFGAMLGGVWSKEMADTLHKARRIAIDISETWTDASPNALVVEEVGFLACTIQHDIEVLYLIDYCVGRCRSKTCHKAGLRARDLQRRDGVLFGDLHVNDEGERTREPDVIQGVGKVYREVFDLEGLGWDGYHPTYAFAKIIDDGIRSQQEDGFGEVKFKGVRILVAEDEEIEGVDVSMIVDCGGRSERKEVDFGTDGGMDAFQLIPGLVAV